MNISEKTWFENYKVDGENSIDDSRKRWARAGASVERADIRQQVENDFLFMFGEGRAYGGGRIMANLGAEGRASTTLYNCFVLDASDACTTPKGIDSLEGIYEQLSFQSMTLKSEGGYGHNFSYIRPEGCYVNGIGSRTPGVLHFMRLWNESSDIITLGSPKAHGGRQKNEKNKIRKGAMMGVLNIWHPQIVDFIKAKLVAGAFSKFNLSVGITEGFEEAREKDLDWDLVFPDTTHPKYNMEWNGDLEAWKAKGYPVIVYETMKARDLWEIITKSTYERNEPGVLNLAMANKLNPLSYAERIQASNPCGEIMMSTGVCNLLSLNLVKYLKLVNGKLEFDFELFARCVRIGVRFSDNINDISVLPLPQYEKSVQEKRRIGVGVLGLGSLHIMLGIRYGSDESIELCEKIFKCKMENELIASSLLGEEKGSFQLFDKDKYFSTYWWKNLDISPEIKAEIEARGTMRNSHRSANAPTGNMGIVAGVVSGGIEPVFSLGYSRWVIVPEPAQAVLSQNGLVIPDKKNLVETDVFKFGLAGDEKVLFGTFEGRNYQIDQGRGLTVQDDVFDYGWRYLLDNKTPEQIEEMKASGALVTAQDGLSVQDHLNVLKVVAKYTDMNSSKTINLPNDYPYEDFLEVYSFCSKNGIKGATTYRDGTMTAVMFVEPKVGDKELNEKAQKQAQESFITAGDGIVQEDVKLPYECPSMSYVLKDSNKKKWYVHINFVDGTMTKPFAIFVNTNCQEGSEVTEHTINDLIGIAREVGIREELIIDQIEKFKHQSNIKKIARSIGFLLRHNVPIIKIVEVLDKGNYPLSSFTFHIKRLLKQFIPNGVKAVGKKCDQCGSENVVMSEGCYVCMDCASSKCS